jgi:exodeoxyribonuclease V gamma subunit
LITDNPRPGDRSLRDEDRYLFLESILSSRNYFYISYVGQSIKDNSTIPPSVLVSEFLDTIGRGFSVEGIKVTERLVTRHRLQAFSRSYFNGTPGLFSYSSENCMALLEAIGSTQQQAVFIANPLKEPPKEMREVSLTQLLHFIANPAKHLLENRLQIRLEEISSRLEEREPFMVEGLEAYNLNQKLLERRLKDEKDEDFLAIAKCRGLLPPARHGEMVFASACVEVDGLVARIEAETSGLRPHDPLYFEEVVGEFRLSGKIDGIWPGKKISYRCAKLKAKDEIRTWIEHLVLNALAPESHPRESLLIMKDTSVTYKQVDNPIDLLRSFLDCYWKGLQMPLRFFPGTSLEYASTNGNLEKARRKWESGFKYTGEEEDPYFQLCFGLEDDPLNDDFCQMALELLSPMIVHRSKE